MEPWQSLKERSRDQIERSIFQRTQPGRGSSRDVLLRANERLGGDTGERASRYLLLAVRAMISYCPAR